MGLIYADLTLVNYADLANSENGFITKDKVRSVKVNAMVDTGCENFTINESVFQQLGLHEEWREPFEMADGTIAELPVSGGISIFFENRQTIVHAAVVPGNTDVLLGAIPMQSMDVLIDPRQEKLVVNPLHPMRAQHKLK
jgi:clan AA aspartic protease